MDKNRTYDGAHANHQWNQDRDFMNLRHRSTTNIPPYRVSRHSPGLPVSPRWHYLAAVVSAPGGPCSAPIGMIIVFPPPTSLPPEILSFISPFTNTCRNTCSCHSPMKPPPPKLP